MIATNTLIPVNKQGRRMGFANLLRNENREWWGPRRVSAVFAFVPRDTNGYHSATGEAHDGNENARQNWFRGWCRWPRR